MLLKLFYPLVERLEDGLGVGLGEPAVSVLVDAVEASEGSWINAVVVIGHRCH